MDMMPTISSIQNSVVLPYNVVPTTLTIAENLMVAGLHGNHRALFSQVNGAVTLNGSAITNPALQGRIAYVTATQGEVTYDDPSTAIPSQRIYIQVRSSDAPVSTQTLDFFIPKANSTSDASNMGMYCTPGLTTQTVKISDDETVPLVVGPNSTIIGELSAGQRGFLLVSNADVNGIWSSALSIARRVVPVLAHTGLEIYKELQENQQTAGYESDRGILSGVLALAKAAAPIGLSMLSSILENNNRA
tara:strand:- start:285 stop:1025 length:741 start_codon:yes stop_codon:yes gene_type:complete